MTPTLMRIIANRIKGSSKDFLDTFGKNRLISFIKCFGMLEINDKDLLEKLNNQIAKRK